VSSVVVGRPTRRLATLAVVVLALGAFVGLAWESGATIERGHATIAIASHHHAAPPLHLEGVAALLMASLAAQLWTTERISRTRVCVPAAASLVRRRGPPDLPAY
jgi:hypothetical protein